MSVVMDHDENNGVHVEHCCIRHGCKYNDKNCPVACGRLQQAYRCDVCDDESKEATRAIIANRPGMSVPVADPAVDFDNAYKAWSRALDTYRILGEIYEGERPAPLIELNLGAGRGGQMVRLVVDLAQATTKQREDVLSVFQQLNAGDYEKCLENLKATMNTMISEVA